MCSPVRFKHGVRRLTVACWCLAILGVSTSLAWASRICCTPVGTSLAVQLADANTAILVSWVQGEAGTEDSPGTSTYRIQQVVKNSTGLSKDQMLTLSHFHSGKAGEQFLLLGTDQEEGAGLDWRPPVAVSNSSFAYIVEAPALQEPASKRLAYFLKFLDHTDAVVSNDAFAEFANAEYQHIEELAGQLPREKLRRWIDNPETNSTRLGLYGVMLGLCGDDSDAALLEKRILIQTEEYRLEIDGMIAGYLLIRKDKGLDVLDKQKLQNKKTPFTEVFATMQALRFMWTYGTGRIAPERLQQSMRILLDRPEMVDLVIADLARWKDWGVQDRLLKLYGEGEYNTPSIKRAIVRFMLVSSKDVPSSADVAVPPHVVNGKKALQSLRKKDPKTVSEAERFFVVP